MVYSTRRFVLCLTLCHFVLVFFSPFSVVITSLGKRESKSLCFSYVCSICACSVLSVSSNSWCLRRAAVCDYGTPWTFLLPFLSYVCYPIFSSSLLRFGASGGMGFVIVAFPGYLHLQF